MLTEADDAWAVVDAAGVFCSKPNSSSATAFVSPALSRRCGFDPVFEGGGIAAALGDGVAVGSGRARAGFALDTVVCDGFFFAAG